MQGWMVALIIVAGVVAFLAVAFLAGSLFAVHAILGRRKEMSDAKKAKLGYNAESYGVNSAWFGGVKDVTERLSLTAYDGVSLGAMLIKQPTHLGRVAICCHGYGATQRSMQVQAKLFYDRGFDVLLPAMRGHEGSGGKVGMAWVDRFDLLRWIDTVIDMFGKNVSIAICGTSMGASTVTAAASMNPPPQVKCVIADCGFSSQKEVYAAQLKGFPTSIGLLPMLVGVRLVHGYSVSDADIASLTKNMTLPALFIHGEDDKFVPYALGKKLYEACASVDKKFLSVPKAHHAKAYITDPETYAAEFNSFIDAHIAGSEFILDSNTLIKEPAEERSAPDEEQSAPIKSDGGKSEENTDKEQAEQAQEQTDDPVQKQPAPVQEDAASEPQGESAQE